MGASRVGFSDAFRPALALIAAAGLPCIELHGSVRLAALRRLRKPEVNTGEGNMGAGCPIRLKESRKSEILLPCDPLGVTSRLSDLQRPAAEGDSRATHVLDFSTGANCYGRVG